MAKKKPAAPYLSAPSKANLDALDDFITGLEAEPPEAEPSGPLRRYVGDTAASVAKGAVQGVRMLTDIAGADNAASGGLRTVEDFIGGLQSAEAKKDQQEIARILKEAEGKGVLDQVVAGVRAFGVAPLQTMAQAAGSSLPTIGAALIPGAGPAAIAARVAAPLAVGAAQGAGSVKASIYDDVKQRAIQEGRTPEEAEQLAVQAQAYAGENGGQIALGAGLGAWAGKSGLEGAAHRLVHGSSKAVPGVAARVATGAVAEGIPEAAQGGQEQFASNVAQDRAGFQTDAWSGVAANAAMEGLAGHAMGGAMGVPRPAGPALLPENGPMSRAANAGTLAAGGQPLEVAPSGAAASGSGAPVEGATGNVDVPADDTPVFNTLVLDAKATLAQPGVMDAVRARFGDEGASQLLNSLNQAQNPNVKDAIRKKHLQAVEEAVFWLNAQRVQEPSQVAIGVDEQAALPAPDELTPAIGMDSQPTGTMRVDAEGVATPETRVDAINTAQAQQVASDEAAAAQEASDSIEPQARSASAVYGEGLPRRPAPPVNMPERTLRADAVEIDPAAPNAVAQFIAQQATVNTPAARAFVQDYRAGRVNDADVLARITPRTNTEPTADERLAAAAKAGQVKSDFTPSLILNREGKPFKTEMAAKREATKHAGSEVVAVEGGHAVQPAPVETPDAQVEQAAAEPAGAVASAVQEGTDTGGAAASDSGGPAGAGVEAPASGAVEADGLTAKSSKAPAIERRERLKAGRSDVATPSSAAAAAPAPAETAIQRRARLKTERAAPTSTETQAVAVAAQEDAKQSTEAEAEAPVAKQEPASTSQEAPAAEAPAAASPRILARVGRTPNSAANVELHPNADGTLTPVMEGSEMLDFDSGEPIKLPAAVTDEEAKERIRAAGAISSKQHFYAAKQVAQADEGGAAFSRSASVERPLVTVEHDASGLPLYLGEELRLEYPRVTERLEVIEVDGEQVINYPIMSATGFDVLGYVDLLVKDGQAKALLDIEVDKQGRQAGVGRDVIEMLLAANPAGLNISNIVPEARGFWEKMGIPQQNVEGAYDGNLNWKTYADAQNPGAEIEVAGGSQATREGADAGAEGGVDGTSAPARGEGQASTKRQQDVEALVARILARWKNSPEVVVLSGMDDPAVPRAVRLADEMQQSQGAEGDPEGFFHGGKVYLVAPQLGGDADVVRVLFHEALGHFGLRGTFGPKLGAILDRLAVLNAGKVRAKAKQYGLDYDKPSDRRMAAEEVLAEMAQKAPDVGWAKKAVAAIRTWLREHVPGFSKMALSDEEIVRSFLLPARAFVQRRASASDGAAGEVAFSRSALASAVATVSKAGGGPKIIGDTGRAYTPAQLAAMQAVGFQVQAPTVEERARAVWKDAGKRLAQGLVDQFAPIKEINAEAYSLLRLAKGASGAFEAMLQGGKLKLSDGVYDFDETQRGGVVDTLLKPLGGEHHDFFRWVAANRAERLLGEGKEHLFTPDDIKALKTLADGAAAFDYELQHGANAGSKTRDRSLIYADALKTFNGFNKNVLDLAEQSGLIDGESRKLWEHEFYVPFYRVAEEEGGSIGAVNIKGGSVRQQAFKQLKGGKQALNADLMDNTLMNWAHLLDASAKNRAAVATLNAAENMGAAVSAPETTAREMASSIGQKSNVVWVMDGGQKHFYVVEDPYVMTALTSLEYAGMRSPIMKALGSFKHALTLGVTASPFFKVRNLIRDSVQAIGASPLSYNVAQNLAQGWKLTDPKSDAYFRLLAGGGTIHFGTMMEGSEAKRVQALVESGVDASTILNSDKKVKAFYRKFIEPSITAYNELGNRGEAINRASLYAQLRAQGMNHAQASLQARDLMDFSMQGSFTSVRFLSQTVPFLNARLQGLYKLGRAAKEDPARMAAVIGAAALASISLLLAFSDDDDWKKREDWDRNNFWWFKFGGMAFRIPKPFEVGAIATLAERGFEYAFDKEMTGKRFRSNVLALLGDNLSMNPIPQLAKPLLDVYANKDGMSGRPIETMGMQKLKAEYRFNSSTSMTARGVSTALNAVSGAIGKDALSPVQVDALLRGYFGWLGSFAVGAGDLIARPATDQPTKPDADLFKLATGGMVSDLRDAPSRYVSQMYNQATEIEQAYATWKMLSKQGKGEEAAEFLADHADDIGKHKRVERLKKAEGKLSQEIKSIEQGNDTSQVKRERIRELQDRKDQVARSLAAS